jgi:DNA-binding GntR family transcriptional regulator
MKEDKINYLKLSEQVKNFIKSQIQTGELKPGDRIDEKELCNILKLSRTPVREALIQLDGEGIIEILPRRCIRVRKHSLKDIKDIYIIISALEADAAEIAAERFLDKDINKMESLYDEMEKTVTKNDIQKYLVLNSQSHELFIEKAENEILSNILTRLKERLFNFPAIMLLIPEWIEVLMKDHYDLIQLFKKKDKEGIKSLIRKHWNYNRNHQIK